MALTLPRPEMGSLAAKGTARWIETTLTADDGYRFAAGSSKSLLATCFGVCALEHLGELDNLAPERKRAIIRQVRGCQNESTGLFRDPNHGDAVLFRVKKFTPLYIEWQETYFALHALDALDAHALHALTFAEPFRHRPFMDAWLRTLQFDDFWFASNYLMFVLLFMLLVEGDSSKMCHHVLDRMDARQDPATGFWGTQQGASLFNGMAGAFHLYGYYQRLGRPIAHQGVAVRSALRLQESTGLFGGSAGGPCEDLDAIDIFAKLKPANAADDAAVRSALERALHALRACRNPDGSYRWLLPQKNVKARDVTYSGLFVLRARTDTGDMWSCWFRPLAITLANMRLGREPDWPVKFRRLPLLGWHPREVLR